MRVKPRPTEELQFVQREQRQCYRVYARGRLLGELTRNDDDDEGGDDDDDDLLWNYYTGPTGDKNMCYTFVSLHLAYDLEHAKAAVTAHAAGDQDAKYIARAAIAAKAFSVDWPEWGEMLPYQRSQWVNVARALCDGERR